MVKQRLWPALLLGVLALGSAGCVKAPTTGAIIANKGPITVGTGNMSAPREGVATSYYLYIPFVGDIAWGDSSLEAATQNGGIGTVAWADSDNFFVLLFGRRSTIVHGS